MKSKTVIGIPSLNRLDLLERCIESALAGTVVPDTIMVVDNSGGAYGTAWHERFGERVDVHTMHRNLGVAKSWNALAPQAAGYNLILSNDDIVFAPDTLAQLLAVAEATPRAGIVSAIEGQRFSLFWMSFEAYQQIGPFDEQFYPAYFEDNDYARRLTLAGWKLAVAPSEVRHGGSSTLQAYTPEQMERHHQQFRKNRDLFVRKWGGMPGQETFTTPYGV